MPSRTGGTPPSSVSRQPCALTTQSLCTVPRSSRLSSITLQQMRLPSEHSLMLQSAASPPSHCPSPPHLMTRCEQSPSILYWQITPSLEFCSQIHLTIAAAVQQHWYHSSLHTAAAIGLVCQFTDTAASYNADNTTSPDSKLCCCRTMMSP